MGPIPRLSQKLPNERWRRWATQRASSSLSTERAERRAGLNFVMDEILAD
jgi:hypothetical protein